MPASPIAQALELHPNYVVRPHLEYLDTKIVEAVRDMEQGVAMIATSMPPRWQSTLTSLYTPLWMLRRHPEWRS